MLGKIIKGISSFYYVKTDEDIIECKARGIFRRLNIVPLAGDNCEIELTENGKGNITKILKRKNELVRPPAANIDNIFIVTAPLDPLPVFSVIDRLTVIAVKNGITPYIIINKTDLGEQYADIETVYRTAGFRVFCVSAKHSFNTDEITLLLQGKVSVIAGCSGVGKSSLLNVILPQAHRICGETSRMQRGRHTTREVELIPVGTNGYIADSPGFSSLEIENIDAQELENYFPEFQLVGGECRFRGCSHINEPDCRIKTALSDGKISQSRYDSYSQLYSQLKEIKKWQK